MAYSGGGKPASNGSWLIESSRTWEQWPILEQEHQLDKKDFAKFQSQVLEQCLMHRSRKCLWHYNNFCPKWGGVFIFAHGNSIQCNLNCVFKRKGVFLISSRITEVCIGYGGVTATYLPYSSLIKQNKHHQFSLHCSFYGVQIIYPHVTAFIFWGCFLKTRS